MKKYILLNIFLLMVTGLNAQITASNVISMIDSNSRWTSAKGGDQNSFITSYNLKIKPDSTLSGVTYGKILQNSNYNNPTYTTYSYCFEKQGKFYFIKKLSDLASYPKAGDLIYDFNAIPKDTLETRYFLADSAYLKGVVDSISNAFFAGKNRKIIYFTPKYFRYKDPNTKTMKPWSNKFLGKSKQQKWIEGIGDINGGLFSMGGGAEPMLTGPTINGYPIVCYERNAEMLYQNKSYPSCDFKNFYPSGVVNEQSIENALTLYPNPANTTLGINTSLQIAKLLVYQSNGTKVLESKVTEKLDVSALPEGLYLLEVWDMEGRRVVKKFEKR